MAGVPLVYKGVEVIDYTDPEKKITRATMRYLTKKNVTLWQSWEITKKQRRQEAANWLAFTIHDVAEEATLRELFSVLYDSRITRWRRKWQNRSTRKPFRHALRSSVKLARLLRLNLSSVATSISVPSVTLPRLTSARFRMMRGSTSDFLALMSRHADMLGGNSRS